MPPRKQTVALPVFRPGRVATSAARSLPAAGKHRFASYERIAPSPSCRSDEAHVVRRAASRADWTAGKLDAIRTSLTHLEHHPDVLDGAMHIGHIAVACSLLYLDFRFPDLNWRQHYPTLARTIEPTLARESLKKERAVA